MAKKIWERVSGITRLQASLKETIGLAKDEYASQGLGDDPAEDTRTRKRIAFLYSVYYGLQGLLFTSAVHEATILYFMATLGIFYLISCLKGHKANPVRVFLPSKTSD